MRVAMMYKLSVEQLIKMKVAEMIIVRWICSVTRLDKIRNEYTRSLGVTNLTEKIRDQITTVWKYQKKKKKRNNIVKKIGENIKMTSGRGTPKKQ